ncbi:hypothetical protein Tco_0733054, partial [Tanacetum coccineum]
MPTASVVIRDTPSVSVSKKKAPAKADRSKGDGTDFESGVPDEQQRKTSGTDEGTGTKPGVPGVPKYQSESDDESWGNNEDESNDVNDDENANDYDSGNEDDDGNDAHDIERIDSDDDDVNPSFTLKDYDEEEHDEEYESDDDNENVYEEEDDDLYKDVDVRSLEAEHEQESKGDAEMTDADQNKTESSKQSSSVSSNFVSQFLILDNVPPVVDEVASMMNVKIRQEESSTQAPSLFTVQETTIPKTSTTHTTTILPKEVSDFAAPVIQSTINESLENVVLAKSSSQPMSTYEAAASLIEFELKKILLDKIEKSRPYQAALEHRELYDRLVKSYNLEKDLFSSYGNVYSLKRDREDEDKDEDPPAGSNQGSSKGLKYQSKSSGKSAQAEEPVFETADIEMTQDQGDDIGNIENQPNVKEASKHDWFKKPEKPPTPDH